ncbi:MAG: metal ABC transporter ATP-binding protein [Cypionkella sp.]|nr:metal ABC transporter ATP-binding protein [Cypionkella sp.]
MSLISAQHISVTYSGGSVLSDVSVAIDAGEIVTLVGPNGSGKSTLLRALLGIVPLSEGQIARAQNLRIGYVPQKLAIDRAMPLTVGRFLSLPQRVLGKDAARALSRVGLGALEGAQMAQLSGGQMQRAMLARALLSDPQLLVLDEPTQGLDQQGEAAFYRLIEELRLELGAAVLMVSHDLHVVMAASDRVICLNGHICCQGAPHVVSSAPEYRALFGLGTLGALALYQHAHDHRHDGGPAPDMGHKDAFGRSPTDPHYGHSHA